LNITDGINIPSGVGAVVTPRGSSENKTERDRPDVAGQVTGGLSLMAACAHTDTEITQDNQGNE
jgi:hypothetical protein